VDERLGLWSRARKRKSKQHQRRERHDHFGELVQLDGSFHDWFEGRDGVRRDCLMTIVDDATSRTLLSMGREETTMRRDVYDLSSTTTEGDISNGA